MRPRRAEAAGPRPRLALALLASCVALGLVPAACVNDAIPARPLVVSPEDGGFAGAGPDGASAPEAPPWTDTTDAAPAERPASVNAVWPGRGCGQPLPAQTVATMPGRPIGYTKFEVMATGETLLGNDPARSGPRTFWVRVPVDYDQNHPYRVVYIGQGCGAYYSANTSAYPLFQEALGGTEQAIYVAIDIPKNAVNMDCYDNRAGAGSQEWEAFQLFHDFVDSHYCADNNRVYVSGYSTGGWLANMWGCYFAGDGQAPASNPAAPRKFAPNYHIRAQAAAMSGEPANNPRCNGPVAGLWLHDEFDNGNPIAGAYLACSRALKMNGCLNTPTCDDVNAKTTPWHPEIPLLDVCSQYTGCPADYPVVFCKTQGLGHSDQGERAVAAFSTFFKALDPAP